ncbi:MAG: TolC family protein [Chitinophagaceae bacterium]|nr:TolC family protein [Chitinophagaceae bacterium]
MASNHDNLYLKFRSFRLLQLVLVTVSLFSLSYPVQAQQVLTLGDCIRLALKNNVTVKNAENNEVQAKITYDQSRMQRIPQVSFDMSQGVNTGRSIDPYTNLYIDNVTGFGNYGLSAGILLFNGMQLTNTIKRNQELLTSLGMDKETSKNILIMQLIAAYISVISNTEIEKAVQVQLQNSKTQLEGAIEKVKAGILGEKQLADFQALVAVEELEKENAKYALERSRLDLFLLMNMVPEDSLVFSPLLTTDNLPEAGSLDAGTVYQDALKHFPDIKAIDARKKAVEYDLRIAKGSRLPSLSLYTGLYSTYSSSAPSTRFEPDGTTSTVINTSSTKYITVGGNDYFIKEVQEQQNGTEKPFGFLSQIQFNRSLNFGVSLRIPIINGMQSKYKISAARANMSFTNSQLDAKKTELLNTIKMAILNYTNTQNRISILTRQQKAYEQSVSNAAIRLSTGTGSTLDYLLSKTSLDRSIISLIQTKYEQTFRWKIINFYSTGTWD